LSNIPEEESQSIATLTIMETRTATSFKKAFSENENP